MLSGVQTIPQTDPGASYRAHREEIDAAVQASLAGGWYILGEAVAKFEREFAEFIGANNIVGVANGTDAITLALKALGVGPGDAVVTVSHTALATLVGIQLSGATPILVDVDAYGTLDPRFLEDCATLAGARDLRLAAIVPVHLYGQPADLEPIMAFAKKHGAVVIEDCAQSHGALWNGQMTGSITEAASFSFYPTKNLGAFGDGGAVALRDADAAARAVQLRQYGWDTHRLSQRFGMNSRLDEVQAAILRCKLPRLASDIARRRAIAAAYDDGLGNLQIALPKTREGCVHAWHQYVVSVSDQADFRAKLGKSGVATAIHYAPPNHVHPAYKETLRVGSLARTEHESARVVSLPMFPEMTDEQVNRVIDVVRATVG